ncbi:MAG: peptidoglycan-binding protein [Thermoleophilia bacterium]
MPAAAFTAALPAQTVQLLLVVRGLMPAGAVNGRFDRATADAVAGFQAEAGLDVTGVASRETADALLALHRL